MMNMIVGEKQSAIATHRQIFLVPIASPAHAVVIASDGNNRLWCKGKAFEQDLQCKSICQIAIYAKTTIFPKQMLYPYLPFKTESRILFYS